MEIRICGTVAPYPKGDMNCPSFLVSDGDKKVLLDCGNGSTRLIDMYKDLKDLIVILSHFHPDHYADIFALGNLTYIKNRYGYLDEKVDVYIPKILEELKSSPNVISAGKNIADYNYIRETKHKHFLNFQDYSKGSKFLHGNMEITFFKTMHDLNGHAIKIKSDDGIIVYSGDTGYDEGLADFAKKADIFICEATFLKGQVKGRNTHLYAYEAGKLASLADVKDLYLFHTYPEIDKEEYVKEAKEYFDNTHSLKEGQILSLTKEEK